MKNDLETPNRHRSPQNFRTGHPIAIAWDSGSLKAFRGNTEPFGLKRHKIDRRTLVKGAWKDYSLAWIGSNMQKIQKFYMAPKKLPLRPLSRIQGWLRIGPHRPGAAREETRFFYFFFLSGKDSLCIIFWFSLKRHSQRACPKVRKTSYNTTYLAEVNKQRLVETDP